MWKRQEPFTSHRLRYRERDYANYCEMVCWLREGEGGLGSDRGGVQQLKRKSNLPFNNLSISKLASLKESHSTGKKREI